MTIPDKNYFRIGEVSKILGVKPYVVRYWESEFVTVRPVRTRSDQRLYRKKDVEQLLAIKTLLYNEMYTIAGARKRLIDINRQEGQIPSGDDGRLIDIQKRAEGDKRSYQLSLTVGEFTATCRSKSEDPVLKLDPSGLHKEAGQSRWL